jgi:hypothetical protein
MSISDYEALNIDRDALLKQAQSRLERMGLAETALARQLGPRFDVIVSFFRVAQNNFPSLANKPNLSLQDLARIGALPPLLALQVNADNNGPLSKPLSDFTAGDCEALVKAPQFGLIMTRKVIVAIVLAETLKLGKPDDFEREREREMDLIAEQLRALNRRRDRDRGLDFDR